MLARYPHLTDPANQPLPRVIAEGIKLLGTRETPGAANNPVIMAWAAEVGEDAIGYKYTGDSVAWCGLAAAIIAKRAGKKIPYGPLWALNWSNFGTLVGDRFRLQTSRPLVFQPGLKASLGDVLVFKREGGGHVGFYIGEDANHYCVLGGNQSDAMTITWIEKSRCVSVRRPAYTSQPASVKPFPLTRSGAISRNEA